jgi:hypothetical protein
MNRILVVSAAVVLIAAAAVYQGLQEGRWIGRTASAELQSFAARLENVPMNIGEWEGTDDQQDPQILEVAGVVGAVSRTYTHRYTSDKVSIFLVCADRRAVSTHTPDKCYQAAGFKVAEPPQPYHLSTTSLAGDGGDTGKQTKSEERAGEITLLNGAYVLESPHGTQRQRVFWAWSKDGTWIAPEGDARWKLRGSDAWYKLYIFASEPADARRSVQLDQSPCVRFAREFLPVAQQKLFEEPSAAPAGQGQQATAPAEPAPAA